MARSAERAHRFALVQLLSVLGLLALLVGCPTPQPRLDNHQQLRLRGLQGDEVEDQVVQAIADSRDDVLEYHIRTLGQLGSARSIILLELIRDEAGNDKVRAAAADALKRIGSRQQPDLLAERKAYFDELQETVRDKRIDAIKRMEALMELNWFGEETAERVAESIAEWFTDPEANTTYRAHALRMAYRIGTPSALRALCGFHGDDEWYEHEVPYIYQFAKQSFPDRYPDVLRDCLKAENLREGAILVLGLDGDEAVVPFAQQWLGSGDPKLQERALKVMQRVENDKVLAIAEDILGRSKDPSLVTPALNAIDTNYQPPAPGQSSRAFTLIRQHISDWKDENRQQALRLLRDREETGPRELYYSLMTNDDDAQTRMLAIELRGTDTDTRDAQRDAALLAVLRSDDDRGPVTKALETVDALYGDQWVGNNDACEALLRLAKRAGSRSWAPTRAAGLKLLGKWGRFADASEVEALANPEDYDMLHGRYAAAGSEGLRGLDSAGDPYPEVPEYACAEEILLRNQERFEQAADKFSTSASDRERAFILHYIHLAEGSTANDIWKQVVTSGEKAAKDLLYFQPFSLPRDPFWLEMFEHLAKALDSPQSKVADAAFRVLTTRYLVRGTDDAFRHGQELKAVFQEGDTRGFVRVLTPIFLRVVEGDDAERQRYMVGVVRDGVLPGGEVAKLAKRLFEAGKAEPELATVFLAQLETNVTGDSLVENLVPVMIDALAHPDRGVRRRVAAISRQHFDKIENVTSEVAQLVSGMCKSDDDALRAAGGLAINQMATRAAGQGIDAEQLRLVRNALQSFLSSLAADERQQTRETAAGALGTLAAFARDRTNRREPFFQEMLRIAQTFVRRDQDHGVPGVMRPVSQFFAAIGDDDSASRSALIRLLDMRDKRTRLNALDGLARQTDKALVEPLQEWLRREGDRGVRSRGLDVYQECGVKARDMAPAIWVMTDYPHRQPGDVAVASAILESWVRANRSPAKRQDAFIAACQREGEEVYPLFLPALQEVATAKSLPFLETVISKAPPGDRALAAEVVARIDRSDKADALLEKLINDDEAIVRRAAIKGAGEVGRYRSMAALLRRESKAGTSMPADEASALRAAISSIVKRMADTMTPDEQIRQLLQLVESSPGSDQKAWFLDRIAEVEHDLRSDAFRGYVANRDDKVRLAAVRNLLRVDGADALPHLKDRLRDSHQPVREAMVSFLSTTPSTPDVRSMLQVLLGDDDEQIRRTALKALTSDTSDPSVLAVLRRVLREQRDSSWKIRRDAVDALGLFRVAGTLELLYFATEDEQLEVRESAIRGLTKVVEDPGDLLPDEIRLEAIALAGLDDGAPEVKVQALELVRVVPFRNLLPQVEKLIDDRDRSVRVKADRVAKELKR